MTGSSSHLLAQVALTVSPFISLPSTTTLPYTYKTLPSGLPPSSTADQSGSRDASKPAYIVSPASGQAAHPKDIEASCQKLRAHLDKVRSDSQTTFDTWQQSLKDRELAEKRRVAPGWLDRDEKILQPARSAAQSTPPADAVTASLPAPIAPAPTSTAEGDELDRAFGKLDVR